LAEFRFHANHDLLQTGGRVKYFCKCSFLEIFQEQISDLLNPALQNLPIREDAKRYITPHSYQLEIATNADTEILFFFFRGVFVENLTEEVVSSPEEAYKLLVISRSSCFMWIKMSGVPLSASPLNLVFLSLSLTHTWDHENLQVLGAKNRHTSPTAMNERSSRSHSVFTLSIESKETKGEVVNHRYAT
jgi:kinesin family protein 15